MARQVINERKILGKNEFAHIKAFEVPVSEFFPEGIKYSMSFVKGGKCVLRYDNEKTKGHHRHFNEREYPLRFTDLQTLKMDFLNEVDRHRRGKNET